MNNHQPREITFHLTLTEEDRELLDTLVHRMGVSRTETISRAPHLLEAVQEHGRYVPHVREEPRR